MIQQTGIPPSFFIVEHTTGKSPLSNKYVSHRQKDAAKKKPSMEMDGLSDCLPCEKS